MVMEAGMKWWIDGIARRGMTRMPMVRDMI
jgi:hypothetical protein